MAPFCWHFLSVIEVFHQISFSNGNYEAYYLIYRPIVTITKASMYCKHKIFKSLIHKLLIKITYVLWLHSQGPRVVAAPGCLIAAATGSQQATGP